MTIENLSYAIGLTTPSIGVCFSPAIFSQTKNIDYYLVINIDEYFLIFYAYFLQDNFGYDLPAVEAAMKKHEAIEADISSYEERMGAVVELAMEMESEGYYDIRRIMARKDNILKQWDLLKELVTARKTRLEKNLALQKTFQEMVYMIDWMEEMQV